MLQGVKMVDELKEGVEKFMVDKASTPFRRLSARAFPTSQRTWISCRR
jgi:hypothetical protein